MLAESSDSTGAENLLVQTIKRTLSGFQAQMEKLLRSQMFSSNVSKKEK